MKDKWKVRKVSTDDIVCTELNANFMSKADFDKLVDNIRQSGLSSMIACYRREEDGMYVIVSGNHRYRACVELGYTSLNILCVEESELSKDERIAVQLSHNSLHGSDDKGILKRLFDEIEDVNFKEFSHISVDELKADDVFNSSIVPVSEHYKVSLVFYRRDMDLLEELLEITEEEVNTSDLVILVDGEEYEDKFLDVLTQVKRSFEIKSASNAFSKVLELASKGIVAEVTENKKKDEK